ncbi:MAG: hypothetical protein KF754_08715 [Planctomycetes bacterium]|nr:hypothetical protein [Planctomycetota bacterium]
MHTEHRIIRAPRPPETQSGRRPPARMPAPTRPATRPWRDPRMQMNELLHHQVAAPARP